MNELQAALLLTADELIELTGCKLKSRQRVWLDREGIRYVLTVTGHPKVARAAVLAKLGAGVAGDHLAPRVRKTPNFDTLRSVKR